MVSDHCGSSLLVALPEDALTIVNQFLSPKDVCNLGSCCRSLYGLASSDEIWIAQCEKLGILLHKDLVEWRNGVASYKALFRFLAIVQPLIGIWVHQNPELGNVVYVIPGFISVVGCRIIPQKLGPLGMDRGPILWAPVFEIIGDFDGSAVFFLHGREGDDDYLYPGSFKPVDRTCNALSLEVEPRLQSNVGKLVQSKGFDTDQQKKISGSDSGQNTPSVPFSRLPFDDRKNLLETVTGQIHLKVPDSTSGPFFPCPRSDEESIQQDMVFLRERRSLLIHLYTQGGGCSDSQCGPNHLKLSEIGRIDLDGSSGFCNSLNGGNGRAQCAKRKTLARYFGSLKQILGRSSSKRASRENEHAKLHEFLRSGDAIGLTLHASKMVLSSYHGWPNMHDSFFALHKLPVQAPKIGKEYAGLWGGTFGWPPGRPGKALFFLSLSYEESQGQQRLIATKILEGTRYVQHPNGSPMFTVNIDQVSRQSFPWDTNGNSLPVDVLHAFVGEGIADGYGFRYPGSKPGSLFVIQGELLAFVWKETKAVLTLQRLDLPELLKKGEQIHALSPVSNFSYSTRSYSNVFTKAEEEFIE